MSPKDKAELRLNIATFKALGYRLGLSPDLIIETSHFAGRYYDPFDLTPDPRPFLKKPVRPKERRIDKPILVLKDIQKRINQRLLRDLPLPSHICGGVKKKSLLDNIVPHLGARVVVTLDIKNFFPRISTIQVYRVWNELLGCAPQVSAALTRLTTFENHLPQGASTSSALANLVLLSLDQPIRNYCEANAIIYTTWIDDLAFSGNESRSVINLAVVALRAGGFSLPHKKLKIMRTGERMVLTGVLVGRKPGVINEYVSQTRSGIHKLVTGCVPEWQLETYAKRLKGRIAHVHRLNPNRARALDLQLGSALARFKPRRQARDRTS
ncbi:MAG TPA: reverse transcriptase family protein [Pyrinomonadaceae bacterium]|nr:reverse transcriptase family protein [Pyrinomonadaceae bacterium]